MTTLSTHILDTANGHPAGGVSVELARRNDEAWEVVGSGITNDDGRVADLAPDSAIHAGSWRLTFAIGDYFERHGQESFYDHVHVDFRLGTDGHYHVPLLASPWGYSTYRGS